ncbi:MAG: alpha/beta fold hydrolase [Gammaproteobacteria bacterium]|nr:alpha/beta fold hydrolase [Gammaproteobacteria bacterium]
MEIQARLVGHSIEAVHDANQFPTCNGFTRQAADAGRCAMLTAANRPLRRYPPEPFSLEIGALERRALDLDCGRVTYLRHGAGPPLLLVHGIPAPTQCPSDARWVREGPEGSRRKARVGARGSLPHPPFRTPCRELTSAHLWEPLLGDLGRHYDCIAPDLLGLGRSTPAAGADLASPGQADMLAAFLDALGIDRTFAVFHDQGGAHGQQMLKRQGQRLRAVVFTDCVCYDNWPVPIVAAMMRMPSAVRALAAVRLLQHGMCWAIWPQTPRCAGRSRARRWPTGNLRLTTEAKPWRPGSATSPRSRHNGRWTRSRRCRPGASRHG